MSLRVNARACTTIRRYWYVGSAITLMVASVLASADEPARPGSPPTYTRDVFPILQRSCQNCHRRNHVGPFSLENYEQARKRAFDIAAVAGDRSMPPWKPVAGTTSPAQARSLVDPARARHPRRLGRGRRSPGRGEGQPRPPNFTDGWTLGTPDLILEMREEFRVPATGPDVYRCFVIPMELTTRRHDLGGRVSARESAGRASHHGLHRHHRCRRERDAADPGPGYTSYPGPASRSRAISEDGRPAMCRITCPTASAASLPARSDVLLQVHYHPSGKPEVDRTQFGIYFCKKPVRQTLHWANATTSRSGFRRASRTSR